MSFNFKFGSFENTFWNYQVLLFIQSKLNLAILRIDLLQTEIQFNLISNQLFKECYDR